VFFFFFFQGGLVWRTFLFFKGGGPRGNFLEKKKLFLFPRLGAGMSLLVGPDVKMFRRFREGGVENVHGSSGEIFFGHTHQRTTGAFFPPLFFAKRAPFARGQGGGVSKVFLSTGGQKRGPWVLLGPFPFGPN